jgi:UDP-glucose 4-epimerase
MSDARRYLVTGGAGFIGSHIVEALLQRGHEVVVLDDLSTGRSENLEEAVGGVTGRLRFIESSLLDTDALTEAVTGVDAVLHQAAIPSVPRSFADPVATMRANVEGTTSLLNVCQKVGVRRVAMASSSSLYGDTPTLPKDESMRPSPMSPYALSKLAAEQAGAIFARTYGMEVYALRYFNVFGPRQDPTSQYSAVIPKFITLMHAGKAPTIYGDGEQSRDFTYVDNVVRANLLAAGVEGDAGGNDGSFHALNIGCGERFSLLDLVAALNELMGLGITAEHADPRAGDVRHSHAAIDQAHEVLGYEPSVDFREGLSRTVEYFTGHR